MSRIQRVEITEFTFEVTDLGQETTAGVANIAYRSGDTITAIRYAVRITTDDGAVGAYVTHWVGTPSSLAQSRMLAPRLIGRDPDHREAIYDDLKRELRAYDHMGHGPLDIALWDLAARRRGMSVSAMLGGYKDRLPVYASTYHAQETPGGLDSPRAFADFAAACQEAGFPGFKVHGWHDGNVAREIETVRVVRERVGDAMKLMVDPACDFRTWNDALALGRACDEANCFWYEDPYRDAAVSAMGHKRLREKLKTPLLVSEHVRGLEQKADFLLQGGCDMIHADPEYDMGITGAMKIAHFCEALGLDVQFHATGPAHRACNSALRNTHLYELALVGPGMPNCIPPVYTCGYSDQLDAVDSNGTVPVPQGPGLGVEYDWDYMDSHAISKSVAE